MAPDDTHNLTFESPQFDATPFWELPSGWDSYKRFEAACDAAAEAFINEIGDIKPCGPTR